MISKKASLPPLGLLTVASMLPASWAKKLVDVNVSPLSDRDIQWADYVFIGAMEAQRESTEQVIARCHALGAKIVAGGPMFATIHDQFPKVDHFVLNEAEVTLPQFLVDLDRGVPKRIYETQERPSLAQTPTPMWSLLNMRKYSSMNIQYSRGCPFNCEFCDIVFLNGRVPRTKSRNQMIAELDALYSAGWRGGVFVVDDNFIGNKKALKEDILPAVVEWQRQHRMAFAFSTEASINLADDDDLMRLLGDAGFNRVFVGIETPNEESLVECSKSQNRNRNLVDSVKRMQNAGLEVQGGFIVGFDSDPLSIFKTQINFIQNSGIVSAMVGLLNAPPGTRLYQRLKEENRLKTAFTGNNTDLTLNFIPKMNRETLINGYKLILHTIYSPKQYYERIWTFLDEYKPRAIGYGRIQLYHIEALIKSMWLFGVWQKGRFYYWRVFAGTILKHPKLFPTYITMTVYGYHFRKVMEKVIGIPVEKSTAG